MKENRRECFKCGSSPAKDPSSVLYRFPKPGARNSLRCEQWAKYCFPNGTWSSPVFQEKLYSEHRMLCNKHFNHTSFFEFPTKRLKRYAAPDNEEFEDVKSPVSSNDNGDDNIDYIVDDDDCLSEPQLFSCQKDNDVNYESVNTPNSSGEREDLHESYKCNMCKGPIYGFRYTCVQCVNYDQCVACEGGAAHQQHYMLRVPTHRPYGEIQRAVNTIRRILSSDIKSFRTEASNAKNFLVDIKSEVVSEAGTEPPDEPNFPNKSRHEENFEMDSHTHPMPIQSNIINSPKKETDEGMYNDKVTSTPQMHAEDTVNEIDTEIDWLDEDILEECEMSHQSSKTTENSDITDLNYQHWVPMKSVVKKRSINEKFQRQLKPARKKPSEKDKCMSLSNAQGNKRPVCGAVILPKIASTTVFKILKRVKQSFDSEVTINIERLSDTEKKLSTNS